MRGGPLINLGFFFESEITMRQRLFQIVSILRALGAELLDSGFFYDPANLLRGAERYPIREHDKLILREQNPLYAVYMTDVVSLPQENRSALVATDRYNASIEENQQIITIELDGHGIFQLFGSDQVDPADTLKYGHRIYARFMELVALTYPRYASISVEMGQILTVKQLRQATEAPYMFNNFYIDSACLSEADLERFIALYQNNESTYVEYTKRGVYLSKNGPFNPQNIDKQTLVYTSLAAFLAASYRG